MTREELFDMHETTCTKALSMMQKKNHDYSGGTGDTFANFRGSLFLGIEPEIGLLLRVMDKFKRIEAFVNTGTLLVKSESVDDAIEDTINYMILLKGLITERRERAE